MSTAPARLWVIVASLLMAIVLTLVPLPESANAWRPEWMALVLVYWAMSAPRRVGIGIAWLAGLVVDVAQGALLGEHALGFAITAYLALRLHRSVNGFPLGQQAIVVGAMVVPYMGLSLWVRGLQGQAPEMWSYWAPVLTSVAVWPLVCLALNRLRPRRAYLS